MTAPADHTSPTIQKLWHESWDDGIWIAPWSKAVAGLTPQQAAWKPVAGGGARHSIWQLVNHVCIWREFSLTRIDGRRGPTKEETLARNFEEPAEVSLAAWDSVIARLAKTHADIASAMNHPLPHATSTPDDASAEARLSYHLAHDCYHLGQIMYVRAMQGLPAIE